MERKWEQRLNFEPTIPTSKLVIIADLMGITPSSRDLKGAVPAVFSSDSDGLIAKPLIMPLKNELDLLIAKNVIKSMDKQLIGGDREELGIAIVSSGDLPTRKNDYLKLNILRDAMHPLGSSIIEGAIAPNEVNLYTAELLASFDKESVDIDGIDLLNFSQMLVLKVLGIEFPSSTPTKEQMEKYPFLQAEKFVDLLPAEQENQAIYLKFAETISILGSIPLTADLEVIEAVLNLDEVEKESVKLAELIEYGKSNMWLAVDEVGRIGVNPLFEAHITKVLPTENEI